MPPLRNLEGGVKRSPYWHPLIYLLVVIVLALALALLAFASAGAVALAGVVVGIFASAGAATVAIAVGFFAESIRKPCTSKGAITGFWLGFNVIYVGTVFLVLAWALLRANDPEPLLLPVFLVLLPLANAVLDWLSLAVTRGFLYAIGGHHHTGLVTLSLAGFDIVLALAFLFGIASLTTLPLSLLNLAIVTWGGLPLLDLQLLLDGLALEPDALEFGWIHFMMLSTLIPTLIHFFVAGFAAVLLLPECLRRWILLGWRKREDARRVAFVWISLVPLLALASPTLVLWGLYAAHRLGRHCRPPAARLGACNRSGGGPLHHRAIALNIYCRIWRAPACRPRDGAGSEPYPRMVACPIK